MTFWDIQRGAHKRTPIALCPYKCASALAWVFVFMVAILIIGASS